MFNEQPKTKDIKQLEKHLGRKTFNYAYLNEDLEEMLSLLSLVNDYVCVSNTNLHLRASLGLTAKVLVPHPPEWRWLNSGSQSPWFPGMQVYRQDLSGDWQHALNSLNQVLLDELSH